MHTHIPLITIDHHASAIFRQRPNRFVGIVDITSPASIPGQLTHIHDPGRLIDLLYPGNTVLLKKASSPHRKTQWDLIAARHQNDFVLIHSGYHRAICNVLLTHPDIRLLGDLFSIKAEITFGHSRLDFRIQKTDGTVIWIEVKGCTLAENGLALFPDAPTKRGTRHVATLIDICQKDERAVLLFLIFRTEARAFSPHAGIDPEFADIFQQAIETGVTVIPAQCSFSGKTVFFERIIPVASFPD